MKEGRYTIGGTRDPLRKQKKRKSGTNFTSSKQKRCREVKKREASCIEGQGTFAGLEQVN